MAIVNSIVKNYTKIIAIDTAKNSFQVCVGRTDGEGKVKQYKFSRSKFHDGIVKLGVDGSAIVMEACATSHNWGRLFQKDGFTVLLVAPQHAKKYLKNTRMKNDANDAEAIYVCSLQHNTRFIKVKTLEDSAIASLHTHRHACVKNMVEAGNRMRGCAAEFGIVVAKGHSHIKDLLAIIDSPEKMATLNIPDIAQWNLTKLAETYRHAQKMLDEVTEMIVGYGETSALIQCAMSCPGIGPITASALVAKISDGSAFDNGRQLAAFLGLVPSQNSTGGKSTLGKISKTGDRYLRALLCQCAHSIIRFSEHRTKECKDTQLDRFVMRLKANHKAGCNIAIALANKMARIVWALLKRGVKFETKVA